MDAPRDLAGQYDPEHFRALGHHVIDTLADALAQAAAGNGPVLPQRDPEAMCAAWPAPDGNSAFPALLDKLLGDSIHLHDPGYIGHQVSAPLPLATLCDLVSSYLNNGMAIYEMGPAATAIEQAVIRWMAERLDFPAGAGGVLTSGGSLGNLTALLAARNAAEARGVLRPVFLVSDQAHYSVARALRIMGMPNEAVVTIPSDAQFRLSPDALCHGIGGVHAAGRTPVAVVACACTTATGTYDPIADIADVCNTHGLWLHVDAAHGAGAVLCPAYRHLAAGIERAASVVWDAHKMLLMPALVTGVVFRRCIDSYLPFEEEAAYLYEREAHEEWYNIGHRTLECTKVMAGLKVYAALACCGEALFSEHIGACYGKARTFARMIAEAPHFELAQQPEANIVCFRYAPPGAAPDTLQPDIRKRILHDGRFYIVQTTLPRGVFLRTTVINPATTTDHLAALLAAIRDAGNAIIADDSP
ncbi:MAG: pyridoxal phosphate-dependent decarboxylase family protein [Candidatus Hydrogenedentota bacterium]